MTPRERIDKVKNDLLITLAKFYGIGNENPTLDDVTKFAGHKCLSTKKVAAALKELREERLVTRNLTPDGIESVPQQPPPSSNAEMQRRMIGIIVDTHGAPNRSKTEPVFDLLSDGKNHSRQELLEATGYTNASTKAFTKLISTMKSHGMIKDPKRGGIQLTARAFPMGVNHSDDGVLETKTTTATCKNPASLPKMAKKTKNAEPCKVDGRKKKLNESFSLEIDLANEMTAMKSPAAPPKSAKKSKATPVMPVAAKMNPFKVNGVGKLGEPSRDEIDLTDETSDDSSHWSVGTDNSSVSSDSTSEEDESKKRSLPEEFDEAPDFKKIKLIPL